MVQAIKKKLNNKRHRNIAIISVLCVFVTVFSVWFFFGNDSNPDTFNLDDQHVPLGNFTKAVTAGDIVVMNISADVLDDVYGYQFDVHYNRDCLEYNKRLYSDINDILTIFATDKETFLLVGATMLGDVEGYSGQEVPVCRVEFTALRDFDLDNDSSSEFFAISRVNVVTGDLQYLENVEGWSANLNVQ